VSSSIPFTLSLDGRGLRVRVVTAKGYPLTFILSHRGERIIIIKLSLQ